MDGLDGSYCVYVVAGGATLEMIDRLKADAESAKKELQKMAQDFGATLSFNDYGRAFFDFNEAAVPDGWERFAGSYWPDGNTKVGRKNEMAIAQQTRKLELAQQFTEACEQSRPTTRGGFHYSYEQIGDKIIVKCPPSGNWTEREYFIPPDSTVIPYVDYIKMKEQAGLLPTSPVVKPFKFRPDLDL